MTEHVFPPQLALSARPLVTFKWEGERVIRIETNALDLELDDEDGERLGKVLSRLDGEATLEDVARTTALDLEEVQMVARQLYENGFVIESSDVMIDAPSVCAHLGKSFKIWQKDVPTVKAINQGSASAALVLGYLIEEWQFVRLNPWHISAAVAHTSTDHMRQVWSKFLSEEYYHGQWLQRGLEVVLTDEELDQAVPLPATVGLVNLLRLFAQTDELAYSMTLAALEADVEEYELTGDAGRANAVYQRMRELDLLPAEVYEPYIKHGLTDEEAGHVGFARTPFMNHPPLDLERRERLKRHAWEHLMALESWHRAIFEFYARRRPPKIVTIPDIQVSPLDTPVKALRPLCRDYINDPER